MSKERFNDVLDKLESWRDKKHGTKRALLSLLGKLVFMCQIISPGRTFIR